MPLGSRRIPLLLVALTLLLPFLSPSHFFPLVDWWKDHLATALIALAMLLRLWDRGNDRKEFPEVPRALLWAWLFALFIVVSYALLVRHSYVGRSLSPMAFLIMSSLAGYVFFAESQRWGRREVVEILARLLWLGALLQAGIGVLQLSGLAAQVPGVVADLANPTGNIIGNIGQRNQYAHYLGWGMAANCYLYSTGKLRAWIFHLSALLLALLMAWSGSRLVLAYGGGFAVLALLWCYRTDGSSKSGQCARQLGRVLMLGCGYIALTQLLLEPLSQLLQALGWHVSGTSGAGRLLDAGFGARRRVEWAKAWQVFVAHPLFGVGWGGFAYYSVWLEAFGGQARYAESVLFTHSHNLFTQLLAETGLVGTSIVVVALLSCLLPYFRRSQVTAENLLLVSLAMVTLGHSMFEYPLWYLPFLCGLMIVLSLSPLDGVTLTVRPQLQRMAGGGVVLLAGWYFITGASIPLQLAEAAAPSRNEEVNHQRVVALSALALNPLWSYDAEQQLAIYLSTDRNQLSFKRELFERLAAYRPFPFVLSQLAELRALDGDADGARAAIAMSIAAYPAAAEATFFSLKTRSEPELQPLQETVERAVKAYKQGGPEAAVRTISFLESRKALF